MAWIQSPISQATTAQLQSLVGHDFNQNELHITLIYLGFNLTLDHPVLAKLPKMVQQKEPYLVKASKISTGDVAQDTVLLHLHCEALTELFDQVYQVFENSGDEPQHTRIPGYPKGFSAHISLAKFDSIELAEKFVQDHSQSLIDDFELTHFQVFDHNDHLIQWIKL